jgi:predicted transcriptional regulator
VPRVLEIGLGSAGDALDRFEAAWNRAAEGRAPKTLHLLTLENLPLLLRTLSPARFELLRALRAAGPVSIYELAKRVGRDYKNVHTDVTQLMALGLITRIDSSVAVPWDLLRAELVL